MTAHAWGLACFALAACAAGGAEVQVTLTDPGLPGATTFAQWVGPRGNALAPKLELAPGTHTLASPRSREQLLESGATRGFAVSERPVFVSVRHPE